MVSLSRSINTNSGGATFFSESVNMEDREHLQPVLDSFGVFKPLKTIPIFSVHLLYTVILNVIAIIFAIMHPDLKSKCREYFIIIYIHIGLWFLTLFLDQFVRKQHHKLRLNGYLEFHQQTQAHVNLPIYVVSFWTAILMLVETLMQHFYPDNFAEKCLQGDNIMSPIAYMCAFITIETCVIAGININYIVKVRNFNKAKLPPDVLRDDWMACGEPENFGQNEIGYRQLGDKVYDLLEKQAALIQYLREHNAKLQQTQRGLSYNPPEPEPHTRADL